MLYSNQNIKDHKRMDAYVGLLKRMKALIAAKLDMNT